MLRVHRNRSSLSVIATVTNKGQMRWKLFPGALHAKVLIGFLKRLTRHERRKLFLILDNLRVHHSQLVKQWLKANADLKQKVTTTSPARTKTALTRTASSSLRSIQKQPQRVQRYFLHQHVRYAE